MPDQFVALPVGQGDAFFLERAGLRVLVDGGKSSRQSTEYLHGLLAGPRPHLDVLICTHNDKDHAEGVRGLLESDSFEVGEVWLPGRWTDRLVELCRASDGFYKELAGEVARTPEGRSLEDDLAADAPMRDSPGGNADGNIDQELLDAIERSEAEPYFRPWWRHLPGPWPLEKEELWAECINAAERIRAIAVAARHLGSRIRWFDFEEFQRKGPRPGGGRPDLVPMNSAEITQRVRRPIPSALRFLSLSVANKESLVFRSPPDGDAPGVLFTADSDLNFGQQALQVASGELVTSPHHGSDANAKAYATVDHLAGPHRGTITWVRSDGRFQSRPGTSFKRKQAQAACTRCKGYSTPGQAVTLNGTAGVWVIAPDTARCTCR